ncbi:MAG: hypothetical protein HC882_07305, partial [Acidobacteria bacterium]|nr:hypothetical protein [Acidobacteriota bacterium]
VRELTALAGTTFAIGLALAVLAALDESPFLLAFGVPARFAWVFVLPWVTGAFGIAGLAVSSRSRINTGDFRSTRPWDLGVAICGVGFAGLVLGVGLG